jgi:hypothetical protein
VVFRIIAPMTTPVVARVVAQTLAWFRTVWRGGTRSAEW